MSGDGGTQADAIDFTSGANSLTLSQNGITGTLSGGIGVGGSLTIDPGTGTGTSVPLASVIHDYTDPTTGNTTSGSLTKIGGGTLHLTAANTYSGGTALDAGTLELGQQSSAGTGTITFGAGAQTLRLDFAGTTTTPDTLAAPVTSFAAGDAMDLAAVSSTATASYANGVLTVSDGTHSDAVTIAAAPAGDEYAVSDDGQGHALVTLAAIPAPTITAPANGTDTNNPKPTILGTGESGDTVDLTITSASGAVTTGTAIVTSGTWSFTPSSALADGGYSGSAVETSPSGTGASATSNTESFTIDTTAPVASSPTLTVAENAGATPIGITVPSDNLTPASSLAIVAGSLPSDGTVTLAEGTTPVTAGETLTSAQLQGLEFTPTPGAYSQGSAFTYKATDQAGNTTTGTAALDIGGPGAPTITGTHDSSTNAEAAVTPFSGVTITDPNTATDTLTIELTGGGGTLSGQGLTINPDGTYTLAAASPTTITAELDALYFTPIAPAPGASATTTLVLTDRSSVGTSASDAVTSVTDTAAPPPPAADTVTVGPNALYLGHGDFELSGTASSPAGVRSVEISAQIGVDGAMTDLGAATVAADGSWTFVDHVGPHVQGFITATETDNRGGTVSDTPSTSLRAGIRGRPYTALQDDYTADGTAYTSTAFERPNGSRLVELFQPGQTVHSNRDDNFVVDLPSAQGANTFMFSHGFGVDTIHGFNLTGAGHDTLDLPASDFTSIADVLRHTHPTGFGSVITDPVSHDVVRLVGVSKAALNHNQSDFKLT